MNEQATLLEATDIATLAFVKGMGVTDAELTQFCARVNANAQAVSHGIVTALKMLGKGASARQVGGKWLITFDRSDEHQEGGVAWREANVITANITVAASSADAPALITALNAFFRSWRSVAGLIATGPALVGGALLMGIHRRP